MVTGIGWAKLAASRGLPAPVAGSHGQDLRRCGEREAFERSELIRLQCVENGQNALFDPPADRLPGDHAHDPFDGHVGSAGDLREERHVESLRVVLRR